MAEAEEASAWYVVIGRCLEENEDSPGVYWGDETTARRKHTAWLRRTQYGPKTREVRITTVVLCSRVLADKPVVIHRET